MGHQARTDPNISEGNTNMTIAHHLRRRVLASLGAAACVGGLIAVPVALAGSASAAVTKPAPAPHPFRTELFTIQIGEHGGAGVAYGPVRGPFRDISVNQHRDLFAFPLLHAPGLRGVVQVDHTAVPDPTINPLTCSGFEFAQGTWQFKGLAGVYRHAEGHGGFDAWEAVQLKNLGHGHCGAPTSVRVEVFGWGHART
jgi:hypothetical protein